MQLESSIPLTSQPLRYATFTFSLYLRDFRKYLDTERFGETPASGQATTIYCVRNSADLDTDLDAWFRRWSHCNGHGSLLQRDDIRHKNIPFLRCVEEYQFVARFSFAINRFYSVWGDKLPVYGLCYISWVQAYPQGAFFNISRHWAKDLTVHKLCRTHGSNAAHSWDSIASSTMPFHYVVGLSSLWLFRLGWLSMKVDVFSRYRNTRFFCTIRYL